jgi:hypothetical protein
MRQYLWTSSLGWCDGMETQGTPVQSPAARVQLTGHRLAHDVESQHLEQESFTKPDVDA